MEIPRKGDTVVRTADGARFRVEEVVEAGGENLYRLEGGEEISEALFVREHDQDRAPYERADSEG